MFRTLSVTALATFVLTLAGLSAHAQDDAKMKFEIYKGKKEEFRWRLKAANGAVLATGGQGYKAKADAKNGIASVQKAAGDAKANFEFYEDKQQEHRWRLKAANGQTIASASEGYKAKADAEKALESVKAGAPKAEVVEVEGK
jgi:uncharacterized protein YegP (UPF0339 family)